MSNPLRKLTPLILALGTWVAAGLAQSDRGSLTGKIVSPSGKEIRAVVVAESDYDKRVVSADSDGRFFFPDLVAGVYKIRVGARESVCPNAVPQVTILASGTVNLPAIGLSPCVCPVASSRVIKQGESWALADPYQNTYIFVEEIHGALPSHLVVIATSQSISSILGSAFAGQQMSRWTQIKLALKNLGLRELKQGSLTNDTYQKVSAQRESATSVVLPNGKILRFFVDSPMRHSAINVSICQ